MKHLLFAILTLWTTASIGQTLEKGIYRGQKTPFIICYLTYNDSTIEVEYFNQKAGQIFGNVPAKRLVNGLESFATKPILRSADDSIKIFAKGDHYLVKRTGTTNIKVYKSTETTADISTLRNRNRLFSFSHRLYDEYKVKLNFDQRLFWNKLNSYGLDGQINLDNKEFNKRLNETREDMNKNWL